MKKKESNSKFESALQKARQLIKNWTLKFRHKTDIFDNFKSELDYLNVTEFMYQVAKIRKYYVCCFKHQFNKIPSTEQSPI